MSECNNDLNLKEAAELANSLWPDRYPDVSKARNMIRIASYRGVVPGAYRITGNRPSRSWNVWRYKKDDIVMWLCSEERHKPGRTPTPKKTPLITEYNTQEWRVIDLYPNYRVNSLGEVKNIKTGRTVKSHVGTSGYMQIKLCKDGKHKTFSVHSLVARGFLIDPSDENNRYEINHKDGDKTNNNVENLEYITRYENIVHYFRKVKSRI